MSNLLCSMGIHDVSHSDKWTPSIDADIVTEYEYTAKCRRCGKLLDHSHLKWDGQEMVETAKESK